MADPTRDASAPGGDDLSSPHGGPAAAQRPGSVADGPAPQLATPSAQAIEAAAVVETHGARGAEQSDQHGADGHGEVIAAPAKDGFAPAVDDASAVFLAADAASLNTAADVDGQSAREPAAAPSPQPALDAPPRESHWRERLRRAAPIGSLIVSLASALLMSRRPGDATRIVVIAVVGFIAVVVASLVLRRVTADTRAAKASRFISTLVAQNLMGQALAFSLPFFAVAAWPPSLVQAPFIIAFTAAVVVVGWDPFFERLHAHPALLVALQAFAALAASLTVLPMLGLTNSASLAVAGAVAGAGVPVFVLAFVGRTRRHLVASAAGFVLVPLLVWLGAPLIPPAPLSIARGTLARAVERRHPVGVGAAFPVGTPELVCHTAISAPLGVKDVLRHVWTRDGELVQSVTLDVSGTSGTGWKTWSRHTAPTPGRYRCRVVTASGQIVGDVYGVVGDR